MNRKITQTEKKLGFWSTLENLAQALDISPRDYAHEQIDLLRQQQKMLEIRIAELEVRGPSSH